MNCNDLERDLVKRQQFVNDLMGFHAAVGTPLMRLPTVNGREVNLLGLYETVTSLGGWERVSDNDQWSEVVSALNFPEACVNNSVALKQIYLRVLDRYEKTHFVHKVVRGEPEDEVEFNIRRMNKLTARALYTMPTTYNMEQHQLSEEQRALLGLHTLVEPNRFDKLTLSLISPLPNEQDFAINVVALLAVHSLDNPVAFRRSSRLLVNLLAHASVFPDTQLRDLLSDQYEQDRGHAIRTFWRDSIRHDALAWLTSERHFPTRRADDDNEDDDCLMVDAPDRSYVAQHLTNSSFVVERVCQIGRILLNLTAHADNASYLASHVTAIRFILLCCDSRYRKISEIGWDLLNCVAGKICLQTLALKEVTLLVLEGIASEDISEVLSALRVLTELAKVESNKRTLADCLDQEMFSKFCRHLTLQDVVVILYTLETLYALSSLDKTFCDSIAQTTGSLSVLVLLLKFRIPLAASFATWKSIRVSETIMSEDGTRRLAEKNLGSVSVRPSEVLYPMVEQQHQQQPQPQPQYRRVDSVASCCAAGECRSEKGDQDGPLKDVVTLTSTAPVTPPLPSSLLCNALRNGTPNGLKPVTVSTVGPAVTLKCHLEEPVTKIVKISNPGNQSLLNSVKQLRSLGGFDERVAPNGPKCDSAEAVTTNHHGESTEPTSNGEKSDVSRVHVTNGLPEDVKVNGEKEPDDYLCEWRGCLRKFKTPSGVLSHICSAHCPQTMLEGKCLWGNCSAGKMVYRFLVKHIQREHCQQDAMLPIRARVALRPKPNPLEARGQPAVVPAASPVAAAQPAPPLMLATAPEPFLQPASRGDPPPHPHPHPHHHHQPHPSSVPPPTPHHPNFPRPYPPIRYYAQPSLAHTPAGEKIAESVRLTSALILRNVAAACPPARRRLLLHEPQIVEAAALDSEASRAAAECLSYLWT